MEQAIYRIMDPCMLVVHDRTEPSGPRMRGFATDLAENRLRLNWTRPRMWWA